jgi:GntR family transcriptional repressor for pyruvate dehydrogenase complex
MTEAIASAASYAGPNLTERAAAHLEELVLGELEPGNSLPSESALASQLGVSRLTVREAVKSLQARGLVELSRGRRPTVAWPNPRPVGDFFTAAIRRDPGQLLDLLEVRHALEVHIASLAARRASKAAVTALELALAAMRQTAEDPERPGQPDPTAVNAADLRFHESLAAATGNQLLAHLMEAMEEPLWASRLQSLRGHLARGGTVADLVAQHETILSRVRARDARGAAAAMRAHLGQTARDLRAAFALADPAAPPATADLPEEER